MTPDQIFAACMAIVLPDEGVHSDDPNDAGGDTWYGIARASHPDIPWPPTRDQAIAIYRSQYFDANNCGSLSWPVALVVFDGIVNTGTPGAIALQRVLSVLADGKIGPTTLAAAAKIDPLELASLVSAERAQWYVSLGNGADIDGWLKRLFVNMYKAAAYAAPAR